MSDSTDAPKFTGEHSYDAHALRQIQTLVDETTELYRDSMTEEVSISERAILILTKCASLMQMHRDSPAEFREIKRRLGYGDGKRGTYNVSEREAREVVKLVLRFEKTRSLITKYTHALSHLSMVDEADIDGYIREKGGLNACAKAWREYKSDLVSEQPKPVPEPEPESVPGRGQIRIDPPKAPALYFCDPDGFAEEVPAELAGQLIATLLERRARTA